MPDADKKFSIKITTSADTAGAQQAAGSLNRLGAETARTSEHMRGMRLIAGLLGRETIPELGHAFHALEIGGSAAIFIGLLSVMSLVKEKITETNKALDDQAEKAKDPVFKEAMDARREAIEKGAEAQEAMADKTAHLIDAEKQYQDALRDTIEVNKLLAGAEEKRAEAGHGFDIDNLKRQLEEGLISQAQYYQKLTALEVKFQQDKLQRQRDALQQEISALSDERSRVMLARDNGAGAPAAALSAETAARAKEQTDRDNLTALEKQKDDAQKRVNDAEKALAKYGGIAGARKISAGGLGTVNGLDEFDKANAGLDTILNNINIIKGRLNGEATATNAAERASKLAEDKQNKLIEEEDRLRQEIARLVDKKDIITGASKDASNDALMKMLLGQDLGGGFSGGSVRDAAELERQRDLFNMHTPGVAALSEAQNKFLSEFEKFAGINAGFFDKQHQVLLQIVGPLVSHDKQLELIQQELTKIRTYTRQLPPPSSVPPPNGY